VSCTGSASADATRLGHDMALKTYGPTLYRWECRSCGRMAYQEGDRIWGSATPVRCDGPDKEADQ
jgi:hypothetical protein